MSVAASSLPVGSVGEDGLIPSATGRFVSQRRLRGMGVFLLLLAVIMALPFGLSVPSGVSAVFTMTAPPSVTVPNLVQPVRGVSIGLAIACAIVGVILITRRNRRGSYLIFSFGTMLFLWSFLVWVGRGTSLNFISLLAETVVYSTPIIYGSLSGVLCERSGVINIAIEGQFLAGAFLASLVASATGDVWFGALAGAAAGALFGWILAFLTLRYGADQIIVGILIDAFALGLTNFLLQEIFTDHPNLNSPPVFQNVAIPLLSKIPVLGPVLFDQSAIVYGAVILLVGIHLALFRTRWGLRVRAVGEHPRAASTVGIHVVPVRYLNVILGGVVAGIGGAAFTVGSYGQFTSNMAAGLGFVALAAMIFGRWRPFGGLGAALLFGFSISLVSFIGVLGVDIPSPLLAMAPYLITIAVVAGLVGRVRPPGADGVPYERE
ncbi:MAG: ABC transporter permease [Acidimicrobiales bacterium]